MKKSLIALAALAAAGAASAQSSVTLFGIVDATIQYGKVNGTGGSSRWALGNSGYNSSRLGFRGTEDLGGGMSASFWLEAALGNDSGAGGATNTNNQASGTGPTCAVSGAAGATCTVGTAGTQGLTFARRSTVSLAGGWGELRLGRDYTPHFWNITVFDPFGTNGIGTTMTMVFPSGGLALGGVTFVRASNSIGYFLPPNLGGVYGQVQMYMGENSHTGAATENDGNGYSGRIGYASGPFNIAAAYGRTRYSTGNERHANIAGQWDFGVAKLMAQLVRDKIGTTDGRGWLLGTLIPVGPGEIRASYSRYEIDVPFTAVDPNGNKLALGYVHNLSKRTALYATYATVRNRNGASVFNNGAVGLPGNRSTGFDLGIRHSF